MTFTSAHFQGRGLGPAKERVEGVTSLCQSLAESV
jgi:hypothetical protein